MSDNSCFPKNVKYNTIGYLHPKNLLYLDDVNIQYIIMNYICNY